MTANSRSRRVTTTGASLHVVEWGADHHPTVIMTHGIRAYAHWFDDLAEALSDSWHVVAYDVRGRGDSDRSPTGDYSVDYLVDDLEDLVEALGLQTVALVGHSLGGQISLNYTARHPHRVQALVLLDAGVQATKAGLERIREELETTPKLFASWSEAEAFVRDLHGSASEQRTLTRLEWMLARQADGTVQWRFDPVILQGSRLGYPTDRRWRAVKRVSCPTWILRGGDSDFLLQSDCEAMVAALPPGSGCTEIPGAGHLVLDDNPDACCSTVQAFLQRIKEPDAAASAR